jgi:hypothetical protein
MTPVKIASVIRYHLSELGARNAHHEFEHLARHLARARLYSNILPATGPVSAGGDRGRDFESFQTHITHSATAGSNFADRASRDRRVVFACSLEQTIAAKIRNDVTSIVAEENVDEIIYFCERDVPISKRLTLIDEAKHKGVILQIFDGTAIAEWLSESDIFWIAQEYLHLPAEINPSSESNSGHTGHRRNWENRTPIPISRADFLAIKAALRHATFNLDARADLPLWLEKMAAFLTDVAPRDLVRDAMYEIAVANLRGRGDMTPQAKLVADYFSDVADHTSIGELIDAMALLTYCFGGFWRNQYYITEAELYKRRHDLVETVDGCLQEQGIGSGRRSGLLRVRGGLEMSLF